jgi:hypothetical protein
VVVEQVEELAVVEEQVAVEEQVVVGLVEEHFVVVVVPVEVFNLSPNSQWKVNNK